MNIILYVDLVVTNRRMRALRDVNMNWLIVARQVLYTMIWANVGIQNDRILHQINDVRVGSIPKPIDKIRVDKLIDI